METAAVETPQPQKLQTKFEVELPEPLAATLEEWFRKAGDVGDINRFASEVLELPLIDYRFENLPPGEEESTPSHHAPLSPAQRQEIFELLDDGESTISQLALRFG